MSEAPVIMVVEDDRSIALALKIRLRAAGYTALLATDVATALSLAESHRPMVSLLDMNLPDGNGLALMQTLQARVPPLSTVFVMMSASYDARLRQRALANGAVAFLEKPFMSKELMDLLERYTQHDNTC